MEENGGAPDPQSETPGSEDPDGSEPAAPGPPAGVADEGLRNKLLIGGAFAAVAVVAAIGFTLGDGDITTAPPGDDDPAITLPTNPSAVETTDEVATTDDDVDTTVAVETTEDATTTTFPTTTTTTTIPPTTTTTIAPTTSTTAAATTTTNRNTTTTTAGAATTVPAQDVAIESIVPDIAAFRQHLATPQQVQNALDRLLAAGGRHDVALPGRVSSLCATVELAGPIEVGGRWERDGDEIASTGTVLRSAPGFGDCIDNDGAPLEDGSYQFLAVDSEDGESPVANFVVGGARIDQQFVNNGEAPVCAIFVAPATSDYFEDYVFNTPVGPGRVVALPVATVAQEVEVRGCGEDETLAEFEFEPSPGAPQPLIP